MNSDQTDAEMTNRHYAVVYQYGKVASTSLVATLNEIPNVTAVQSHFLGEAALKDILPTITDASISEYFYEHQLGQFIANTKVTRHINAIRSGLVEEQLLVVSLARHPLDWFRSSLVQDISGYLETLRALALTSGVDAADDGEMVEASLRHMVSGFSDVLEAHGGVSACLELQAKAGAAALFHDTQFAGNVPLLRMFLMMLRPFPWFQLHFEPAFGTPLEEFSNEGGFWYRSRQNVQFVLLRYEDIDAVFARAMSHVGLPLEQPIARKNESKAKRFGVEVTAAFDGPQAARLAKIMVDTPYAAFFGYD